MYRIVIIFVGLFLMSAPIFALTTNLSSVADTSISARDPNNNSGAHTHAFAGRDAQGNNRRALYLFDLSAIAVNATINSATLTLTVIQQPIGDVDSNFELHAMTTNWFEGGGSGNNGLPAIIGESTWNNRIHNTTPWSAGAGANGDFTVSVSALTPVTGLGSFSWSSAQLTADVQHWVEHPEMNFGWIIISDNEITLRTAKGFAAREEIAVADRPVLEIDYSVPPPPPPGSIVIQGLTISDSTLSLLWSGPANVLYDIQYRPSLTSPGGWETVESNIVGSSSGINEWIDPPPLISPSNAFFRVQGR